jgi:hypothetical protein
MKFGRSPFLLSAGISSGYRDLPALTGIGPCSPPHAGRARVVSFASRLSRLVFPDDLFVLNGAEGLPQRRGPLRP